MLVEDYSWKEEVDLEDEDDAVSDLDSKHTEEQSHLVTSLKRQFYPCYHCVMDWKFEFQYS